MSNERDVLMLFDGVCNFCNDTVMFVIDRDPNERFQFAPLESELAQRCLREHGVRSEHASSVVITGGRAYTRSDAALQMVKALRWPWPLLYLATVLPRGVRDAAYDWFAARRYRFFGKSESCRVPTPALRRRFLA